MSWICKFNLKYDNTLRKLFLSAFYCSGVPFGKSNEIVVSPQMENLIYVTTDCTVPPKYNHFRKHISNCDNSEVLVKYHRKQLRNLTVIFFCGAAAQRGLWPPHSWGFLITHNNASQSVGLLWTSDQLVAETSTWQQTTLTTDKHLCPRWDSNPQSQQASGCRSTP